MKRTILTALFCICAATQGMAQFEIGFSLGYGFPSGKSDFLGFGLASYEAIVDSNYNYTYSSYKDENLSLGNGLKIDVNGCYSLNDNLGVMANIGVSMLGGKTITMKERYLDSSPAADTISTDTWKFSSAFLPINIGLKAKADLGPVEAYVYLAPGLYIPLSVGGEMKNQTTGQATTTNDLTMRFAPAFGFAGGLGAKIRLTDMIGINVEFAPNYAFARMTELKSVDNTDGSTYTMIFKNNEESLPADIVTPISQTDYQHGGPMMSFSSMGAKVGLVLSF